MGMSLSATRQPLFWAAAAFSVGILGGTYLWRPPLWWLLAAAAFAVCGVRLRRSRSPLAWVLALAALAAAGAWAAQAHRAPALPDVTPYDGQPVVIRGFAIHDGVIHGAGAFQRQSIDFQAETVTRAGVAEPFACALRLSLYGPSAAMEMEGENEDEAGKPDAAIEHESQAQPLAFSYGQRLELVVKLRRPRNFRNPGAWDFAGYLRRQGIAATGSAATKNVKILPGQAGSRAERLLSRVRRSLLRKIALLWPAQSAVRGGESEQAALLSAVLLGDRAHLAAQTTAAWQRTGLYHLLVIDGLKVGIFAFFAFWTLRRLRAGDGLATVGTILLSAGYAWLTELSTPALRSVLMLTVFLLTRLLYRERALLNSIGAAGLALLAWDPGALFDAGFQLSFLSVVAIAAISVPLLERTSQPYHRGLRWLSSPAYDLTLPRRVAQFRISLRLLAERVGQLAPGANAKVSRWLLGALRLALAALFALYEAAVISAVLQLALVLPMAIYFHRATIVGVPANAIAVPLTSVVLIAAAIALALSYLWLPLALVPAKIAAWALAAITATAKLFDGFSLADVRLPAPTPTALVAGTVSLVIAMLLMRQRTRWAAAGLALLVGVSVWLSMPIAHPQWSADVLEVTSIDVGQAESTLLVTPQGATVLVDAAGTQGPFTSNFDLGENVVSTYLWARGFTRLDALVLTHAHSDHIGGMPAIIANFRPRQFWYGPSASTAELRAVLEEARKYNVEVHHRQAGEAFDFGGARFEVLAPPPDWQPKRKPQNNDSLVLRIGFGSTSVLLTGDAEKKIERYLADNAPQATVLKLAHNGSRSSTTPEFLAAVHPRYAFISVGARNSFGHPRPEVLARVAGADTLTYRTDLGGALTFLLDGKAVTPPAVAIR